MDSRLNYVWQHFLSVYDIPEHINIGYQNNTEARVQITKYSGNFFEETNPCPEEIIWKTWSNQQIPLFFSETDKSEIIHSTPDKTFIQYDIISSTFYLLSGWQEYYSTIRDKYGRFPYEISIQNRLNIVTIPVVNYYFDILKTAIEKAYGIEIRPKFNSSGTFTTFITHDIDNSENGWKTEGKAALQMGNIFLFLKLIFRKIIGRDVYFNWLEVAKIIKSYGAESTFFFLCQNLKYQNYSNADYDISQKKYQDAIAGLHNSGFEIAVHGSFETFNSANHLKAEKSKLNYAVKGNRFHYLRYDTKITPVVLEEAEIVYDSTMGFAEHFGFRNSYCFPFRPYNFKTHQPHNFLEISLNLMDATLHHPAYLQLKQVEILPAIRPMLGEIKKFGGYFTLLWHNENFSAANKINGLQAFHKIMQFLKEENSNFKTGSQIHQLFNEALN